MKSKLTLKLSAALLLLSTLYHPLSTAHAQGTAFTYQGRLFDAGNIANGKYDLRFYLYDALSAGSIVAGPLTNSPVTVSNGLFVVSLDFGSGVFTGPSRWLEIGARSNGVAVAFTPLTPRQELTPTPYAITAENVDGPVLGSQLTGTLPGGLLSGTYPNPLTLNNAGNIFSGNGAGLNNVNALTLAGLGPNNFWKTGGNAGTTAGPNFVGTTDNQALEIHVNGDRGLRIEPDLTFNTPNVIGGSSANFVIAGSVGNFIGAGGEAGFASNYITGGNLNVIAGGWDNHITNGLLSSIGGGEFQTVGQGFGTIGGGFRNSVLGQYGTVPGGANNLASGDYSFAAGQSAQALHSGAFVWADNSTPTPFASTAANQFVVRAGFMGLNRATRITGAEYFGIRAPVTNAFGGMYVETAGPGLPFYGYAQHGAVYAYTYVDGSDLNKWKLIEGAGLLTVTTGGALGINTSSPQQALDVDGEYMVVQGNGGEQAYLGGDGFGGDVQVGSLNSNVTAVALYNATSNQRMDGYMQNLVAVGNATISGVTQIGSGTGNAEAPDRGLIVRRAKSTTTANGSVVARTDKLTLVRDGSTAGWKINNLASPGNSIIAFTGLTSTGATVNFVTSISSAAAAGTTIVFTDAQNVVSFRGSFGDTSGPNNVTEVSLSRFPTDNFWAGTLTSTFNQ